MITQIHRGAVSKFYEIEPTLEKYIDAILEEQEYNAQTGPRRRKAAFTGTRTWPEAKVKTAMSLLNQAAAKNEPMALAFSGGGDSLVALDLVKKAGLNPLVIWIDSQMEYPETREFIEKTVSNYGYQLRTAQAARTPREQWTKAGWPMLGKRSARLWNKANQGAGFKLNISECCRALKIAPARNLTRNLGCRVQITGQKGKADDYMRNFRTLTEGAIFYQKKDRLWIVNPLTGWTDQDIQDYTEAMRLPIHPAKKRGALTIGCIFCGGGSQFTNSGYRILRKTWPEAWHKFMIEWGGGPVILAIKYKKTIEQTLKAIRHAGGLEYLAISRPWIFDFTKLTPLPGYTR